MAKSKRKRQRRRGRSGGHPARRAPAPLRSSAAAELERLTELAFVEARRRAEEALSPQTPPERVAALVVEEFEDLPSPLGLATRLRRDGSEERARSVAAEVQRLAPGSVTALTLAAEVAGVFDHDQARVDEWLDEALDAFVDPDGAVGLAEHMPVAAPQPCGARTPVSCHGRAATHGRMETARVGLMTQDPEPIPSVRLRVARFGCILSSIDGKVDSNYAGKR